MKVSGARPRETQSTPWGNPWQPHEYPAPQITVRRFPRTLHPHPCLSPSQSLPTHTRTRATPLSPPIKSCTRCSRALTSDWKREVCRKVGLKRGREQTVDWHQKFRTALQRTVENEVPKYREDKGKHAQ